ncbi:MAG: Ig-like domain-containing protein [Candidatus Sericytochromatia bacterium]|nr:Ig-like domain-containing protein [Candidatus Sericytochromatia bacterium]
MRLRRGLRSGLAWVILGLVGCRANATLPLAPQVENPSGAALFSLEISAPARSVAVGSTLGLTVEGRDDRDIPITVLPVWRSSDPTIAAVDAAGVVTGRAAGVVTISAVTQDPPREATVQLSVGAQTGQPDALPPSLPLGGGTPQAPAVAPAGGPPGLSPLPNTGAPPPPAGYGLAIFPASPRVAPGGTLRMLALQGPSGFETPAAAVWRSQDARIATIDDAGVVTGVQAGTVRILAQSVAYPALVRETELAVIAPAAPAAISGIRIRPSRVVMNVGEAFWLQAEVTTFAGGLDPLVSWESGNPAVVSVSAGGQLLARAPGKTTVTAYAAGVKRGSLAATIPVEVRNSVLGRIRDLF